MTTNRSLSWIDRARFAGLVAKVTDEPAPAAAPARRPAVPRNVAPSTTARVAVPPIPAVPPPPIVPQVALPIAPPPPLPPPPPVVPAAPEYPPFVAASLNLEERLQALVAWIEACVPCRAAFIADDNGLPVVEHLAEDNGEVAAASQILQMLASLRSLMRDSGGWLSLKLGNAVLHVVEVGTPWGRFGIGVVTDDALPREFLTALSGAVERAFLGDSQGEST